MMTNVLVVLSSVLMLVCIIPYIVDVIRGKTKPRVVSWFTWALLASITAAASLSDGQYPAGIMAATAALSCLIVVFLGWKHGNRKIERVDIVCQVAALVGIALWFAFSSPAIAVVAIIGIDLIGGIPTAIHAWQRPYEETWLTFLLGGLGALCTVLAASSYQVTAIAHPVYTVLINFVLVVLIVSRHKYAVKGMPPELKEL